jgi:hypothetical protein
MSDSPVLPGGADPRQRAAGARYVMADPQQVSSGPTDCSSSRSSATALPWSPVRCERDATLRAAADASPRRTGLPIRQQRESRWTLRPARPGCARRSRPVAAHCSAPTTRLPSWAQRGLALPRLPNAVARLPTGSEPGTRDPLSSPQGPQLRVTLSRRVQLGPGSQYP